MATRKRKTNPLRKQVTYNIGSISFSSLASAKAKAKQYANDEGYPVTVLKETHYYRDRGMIGPHLEKVTSREYVVKPSKRRNPTAAPKSAIPLKFTPAKVRRTKSGKVQILL